MKAIKTYIFILLVHHTPFSLAADLPVPAHPVIIDVQIQINKIYAINTMNESYTIDAYLVAKWKNPTPAHDSIPHLYENSAADDAIGTKVWIPAFEFINVIGARDIANKSITTYPSGEVSYNERFNATFSLPMNFKMFPFDQQTFSIQMEAFSFAEEEIIFSAKTNYNLEIDDGMSDEWYIDSTRVYVSNKTYYHLSDDNEGIKYSRYNLDVTAGRKINRYLWQLILPLFLIIAISWSVFWINAFSDQIATGFTLMLTLVAFNFHTASILPNIPYITFIESLITLGYASVFLGLLIIIVANFRWRNNDPDKHKRIMSLCRFCFPISFFAILFLSYYIFSIQ